jgi:hypothetical protein
VKLLTCLGFLFLFASGVFACVVNISNIKTSAVYGKVIAETKETIPNVKIQIFKAADYDKILAETTTDANGRFEIKDFPAGKYMIRAKTGFFAPSIASMKLKKSSSNVKNKEIVFILVPECSGWVEMQKVKKSE